MNRMEALGAACRFLEDINDQVPANDLILLANYIMAGESHQNLDEVVIRRDADVIFQLDSALAEVAQLEARLEQAAEPDKDMLRILGERLAAMREFIGLVPSHTHDHVGVQAGNVITEFEGETPVTGQQIAEQIKKVGAIFNSAKKLADLKVLFDRVYNQVESNEITAMMALDILAKEL